MSTRLLITALAGIGLTAMWLSADSAKAPKEENPLMRHKLAAAQKVLEGIAVINFEMIAKNADELILLSKRAEWHALDTPQYTLHSNDFRRHAGELVRMAGNGNVDGTALAYVQLTMSCVNCHKHVREVRMAGSDRADSQRSSIAWLYERPKP